MRYPSAFWRIRLYFLFQFRDTFWNNVGMGQTAWVAGRCISRPLLTQEKTQQNIQALSETHSYDLCVWKVEDYVIALDYTAAAIGFMIFSLEISEKYYIFALKVL